MRIRPRPPADPPAGRPAERAEPAEAADAAGLAEARARADTFWALVLRRFYDHVHRGGQEDDENDGTR
jgi:hypothetical protein